MATSNRTFTGSYTDKDRFKRDELHHELKHETAPTPKKKFFSRSMSHQETKIYHKVPYDKKEEAKKEGMSWDSSAKKWYHNNSVSSNASKFQKEEVGYNDMDENIEFDVVTEIKNIAAKYKEKAEKQVKELKPWTKKGEYKDLAKNIIKKRESGIAKADERLKNEDAKPVINNTQQEEVAVDNMALYIDAIDKNLNFTK